MFFNTKDQYVLHWLFAINLFIQGCRSYTYIPQVPQTPVTEVREMQINWAEIPDVAALQFSYSPMNHLSFGFASNGGITNLNIGFEAGACFYDTINKSLKYGVFGGYGKTLQWLNHTCYYEDGSCFNDFSFYTDPEFSSYREAELNYHKLFLQPFITLQEENIQFNMGIKSTWVIYNDFLVTDSIFNSVLDTFVEYTEYRHPNAQAFIAEPYFSMLIGGKKFKGFTSFGYQIYANSNLKGDYFQTSKVKITIGLSYTFMLSPFKKADHIY